VFGSADHELENWLLGTRSAVGCEIPCMKRVSEQSQFDHGWANLKLAASMDFGVIPNSNGRPHVIMESEMEDELHKLNSTGAKIADFGNRNITPRGMVLIFGMIQCIFTGLDHVLAIDLAPNRLDSASIDDFETLLNIMNTDQLERMVVRFGYEISTKNLKAAMEKTGTLDFLNKRVFVDIPWESAGPTLRQLLDKTNDLLAEVTKDAKTRYSEFSGWQDVEVREQEKAVARAFQTKFNGILVSDRYYCKGIDSDFDGIVAFLDSGKQHILFIEAKHNVDRDYAKAKAQLARNVDYWSTLLEMSEQELTSPGMRKDYEFLQVDTYRSASVCRAIGGTMFSEKTQAKATANGFILLSRPTGLHTV